MTPPNPNNSPDSVSTPDTNKESNQTRDERTANFTDAPTEKQADGKAPRRGLRGPHSLRRSRTVTGSAGAERTASTSPTSPTSPTLSAAQQRKAFTETSRTQARA